jgi:hypothetical protein
MVDRRSSYETHYCQGYLKSCGRELSAVSDRRSAFGSSPVRMRFSSVARCRRYGFRLTEKGKRIAAMFVWFHKRVCGPLANSLFHDRPEAVSQPPAKIEVAYHQADAAIETIIDRLAA